MQGAICTSSMRFKHIERHRTFLNYILTEIARYIDFFHTSSGWFDCTEPSLTTSLQGIQGVQGAICTSSMRFKHIERHRTFLNYILTEIARNIEFFHMSSGWFDCTEPSLTTSLQGIQGVQGAICTSSMRFKHIERHRTFLNYILTEIARNIEFFHMSSGWFNCTEPSLTTSRCLALYYIRVCTCTFCVLTLYNGIALPINHANNLDSEDEVSNVMIKTALLV